MANLAIYAGLPYSRQGLIISLIPLIRTVMSVCTARLLLNLRAASAKQSRLCHGANHHWAFGELGPDGSVAATGTYSSGSAYGAVGAGGFGTGTAGSATLVPVYDGTDKAKDIETQESFLPPVEDGWTRAPSRSLEREWEAARQAGHQTHAPVPVPPPAGLTGEVQENETHARTLALLRGETYPERDTSLQARPLLLTVENVSKKASAGRGSRDGLLKPNDARSAAGSAAASIPSSFRATVMARFSTIANAAIEMADLQPRAI